MQNLEYSIDVYKSIPFCLFVGFVRPILHKHSFSAFCQDGFYFPVCSLSMRYLQIPRKECTAIPSY